MLSGPQKDDYFSENHHLGRGYTPNESSLRTGLTPVGDSFMRSGLTPGGGGSMFPEPSPGSLFNPLQGGAGTPGTVEFRNTALNAMRAQARTSESHNSLPPRGVTSQPQIKPEAKSTVGTLDSHDNDAANGLFLLSHARPQPGASRYPAPPMPAHAHPRGNQSQETSPRNAHSHRMNNGSISTISGRAPSPGSGDQSDGDDAQKGPTTRNKGKRTTSTSGKKKAEETPSKVAIKKAKANNGSAISMMEPEPMSEEEMDLSKDEYNANGKKMTDEEKRKNFLERNRYVICFLSKIF